MDLSYTKNKKNAIVELLSRNYKSDKELNHIKRKLAKKHGVSIPSNAEILKEIEEGNFKEKEKLKKQFRKRAMRTMSGIAPVAVLTRPYECPGTCAFCPTEKDVPQSYLSNEPAVMRAIRCGYNPYVQVTDRIKALIANGHNPTKIELIVIGGTWSYLPRKYKLWYIANCFKAANSFQKTRNNNTRYKQIPISKTQVELIRALEIEQKKNEKAKYNIIGLTLETRPDYINEKELWEMREFGCTRVEIGVQAIDDEILKLNKRGHGVQEVVEATRLLKEFGFKITYHLMPGLPGSNPRKDFSWFKRLFTDERFQPDQIKFYPTVVTKGSLMYEWWRRGQYKPYSERVLRNLIIKCKGVIPEYVRVIRLIRDIPGESIEAGNKVTNLRQVMQQEGVECKCVRCREISNFKFKISNLKLDIIKYSASGGKEYFIQFITKDKRQLLGFCRLRLDKRAMIRELHVYGELTQVGDKGSVQHAGLGKKLLKEAEKQAKKEKHKEISVISGVGVRNYYRKNGFKLKDTYMQKKL